MIASPDMLAVSLLRADEAVTAATGGRISTDLQPGGPAIRVALVGGSDPARTWQWRALIQCDCWASDQADAADLAALVRDRWTDYTGRTVLDTYVSGTWLETLPVFLLEKGTPRYSLTLGLSAHDPR